MLIESIRLDIIGYSIIVVFLIVLGLIYTISPVIMPYHLQAMDSTWEELSSGVKVMSLNYMKSAAAGFITVGVMMLLIIIFPLRNNEMWSTYALLSAVVFEIVNVSYRTYCVSRYTNAKISIIPFIIVVFIGLSSFILSLQYIRK